MSCLSRWRFQFSFTFVIQARVDIHDLLLSFLQFPLLVFFSRCFLYSFFLLLLLFSYLKLRETPLFLLLHWDWRIDATKWLLSASTSQPLLTGLQLIMSIIDFIVFRSIFHLWNIDKGYIVSLLYLGFIESVHVAYCVLVNQRNTGISLWDFIEINGWRWFDFREDFWIFVYVFEASIMRLS